MEDKSPTEPFSLGLKDIRKILPHRYPFLLVDKVLQIDIAAKTIVAQKNATVNEEFFEGHFPGIPIMPGVLIVESLAQAAGLLMYHLNPTKKIAVVMGIAKAKFRRPVRPGDVLYLHAEALQSTSKGGRARVWAVVDEKMVVEAEMSFALVDKEQLLQ